MSSILRSLVASVASVAASRMSARSERAKRELAYKEVPLDVILKETHTWLREAGASLLAPRR